jgi:undecaprenyl-diphosphatase
LGAVQGLTEFLPVSSSGHLVLLQKVFGITEPTLLFDTMLHAGTLLAVFVVLWEDIWAILRRLIQPLTGFLILATIPAVAAALVFEDSIEAAFESGRFLGFSFLLTSALLVIAELLSRRMVAAGTVAAVAAAKKAGEMNALDALIIGVLQAVAIIPGVSRSGATISGALSRGLDRDFAARFSFLLSIPAILGALVFQLKDLVTTNVVAAVGSADGEAVSIGFAIAAVDAAAIAAGTVTAAIVGFFAVRLMLKIVRERSLFGFAIYTAVLGALVLVDQFMTRLVF